VDEVASTVPGAHIALTLALYLTVYAALMVAYVSVVKHMAEKPVPMPAGHGNAAGVDGVSLGGVNALGEPSPKTVSPAVTQPGAGA
jgi:hypothetical protein